MTARAIRRRTAEETELQRPVWRTAWQEAILLIGLTLVALIALRIFSPPLGNGLRRGLSIAYSLIPLGAWYLISFRAEQRAIQPRDRLITVLILGGLAASGVGLPLVERLFTVDAWLPTAGGTTRLIGYTLCVGITQEFLKYLVMRYSVFPDVFRSRTDGVAYGMATGMGYGTVIALNVVLSNDLALDAAILRVTEIMLSQVAVSAIMGNALYALTQPDVPVYLVPGALMVASALAGFAVVLRGGLIVSGIGEGSTGNNGVFGLGMAIFLVILLYGSLRFLINNADERDRLRRRPEAEG